MGGDPEKVPPNLGARRARLGSTAAGLGLAAGAALAGVLVWRIADAALEAHRSYRPYATYDPPPEAASSPRGEGRSPERSGAGSGGSFTHADQASGRTVLFVKAARTVIRGDLLHMEGVELRRLLDGDRGALLAAADRGVYNQNSGSGTLTGSVLVRRVPAGAEQPDAVIRTEALSWDQATGTLTGPGAAELTWADRKSGRRLVAAGTGLTAERWAQQVRLDHDVRVSMAEAALPARLPLTRRQGPRPAESAPAPTVVTCAGPAVFENCTALGGRRVVFDRQARAARGEMRLSCNRLEIILKPEGAPAPADGVELSALEAASAGATVAGAFSRWLLRALAPGPPPAGSAANEQDLVDAVVARGAVQMGGPEGTARGDFAYFDQPAGLVFLAGSDREPAEVVRGENQVLSPKGFVFNLRTEELTTLGPGRARVVVEEPGKQARP